MAKRLTEKDRRGKRGRENTLDHLIKPNGFANPPMTVGLHLFGFLLPKRASLKGGWGAERETEKEKERENMYERNKSAHCKN